MTSPPLPPIPTSNTNPNSPAWNTAQGAKGGCDGSLVLNAEENARAENKGLQTISTYILSLSTKYSVSVADLIGKNGSPYHPSTN